MPVVVKVVSKAEYAAWMAQQKAALAPADATASEAAPADAAPPAEPAVAAAPSAATARG
jgi:heme/copper-type cytochrome/quinol oxidase subunit 2